MLSMKRFAGCNELFEKQVMLVVEKMNYFWMRCLTTSSSIERGSFSNFILIWFVFSYLIFI